MGITMRRAATCVGGVTLAVGATAVAAHGAEPVHIDADEVFAEGAVSTFTSTVDGCESGTVTTPKFTIGGGPGSSFGKFNGIKVFACDDGGSFVVRLQAKFGPSGSTGTWAILGGTGGFEELAGSGTLVGTPTPTGINDVYDGTLRP
jgi:hypothetical protein